MDEQTAMYGLNQGVETLICHLNRVQPLGTWGGRVSEGNWSSGGSGIGNGVWGGVGSSGGNVQTDVCVCCTVNAAI